MISWIVKNKAIVILSNVIGLVTVAFLYQIRFADAQVAIANGIFSYTSTVGYSVTKSLVLYAAYISVAAACACMYVLLKPKKNNLAAPQIQLDSYKNISKIEIVCVTTVIILSVFFNYYLRENVLNDQLIHSEEFINLSAFTEWESGKTFDVAYPYALGNLVVIPALTVFGINIVTYKAFLNVITLLMLYLCVSFFAKNRKQRILFFGVIFLTSLYSVFIPSLHRNLFRFLQPIFFLVAIQWVYGKEKGRTFEFLQMTLLNLVILLLSSADILVITYAMYFLYLLILIINKTYVRSLLVYLLVPFASFVLLSVLFGANVINFFKLQLESIFLYSGHVNAVPYFSYAKLFELGDPIAVVKNFLLFIIFYLPIFLLFNIVLFLLMNFRKESLKLGSFITTASLLAIAYGLYFRQCFGDASFSRVAITSGLFVIILLIFSNIQVDGLHLRFIKYFSYFFLFCLFSVITYFSRYGFISRIDLNESLAHNQNLSNCSETFLAERLSLLDYKYCDKATISELKKINDFIGGDDFYVYDDSFSLYYLLDSRPIVLTPSYYMEYELERSIIDKLSDLKIKYVIYPKHLHFFGVPDEYVGNENFMKLIKAFISGYAEKKFETDNYFIYEVRRGNG